jgi:hypothetical protein
MEKAKWEDKIKTEKVHRHSWMEKYICDMVLESVEAAFPADPRNQASWGMVISGTRLF